MKTPPQIKEANWWRLTLLQFSPVAWVLLGLLTARLPDPYWISILAFGGLGLLYAGHLIDKWTCPRCNSRFHRKGKYGVVLFFRWECANCRLKRNWL